MVVPEGARHTQKKNLYLEWNSIFPNPPVRTLLSTHSFSLLLDKHYNFVNGLSPCSHPRIRYSMKTWGILLWLLVSCFLWKIQPPLSRTNTLMNTPARHTHQAVRGWDQLLTVWVFVHTIRAQAFGDILSGNIILPPEFLWQEYNVLSLFRLFPTRLNNT